MLQRLRQLQGYEIHSPTGAFGIASDFFFDDLAWVTRYLVVDSGGWLTGRQVLISPQEIVRIDHLDGQLHLRLSKEQIQNSPPVEADEPVSRQREAELSRYCGWPEYWTSVVLQTAAVGPLAPSPARRAAAERKTAGSQSLRSVKETTGYRLEAVDGAIGEAEDFLAAEADWTIRYMLVDTGRFLPGRKVLIAPSWVGSIDWSTGRVHVGLTKQEVRSSRPFDPDTPLAGDYEARLHEHYGKAQYWLAGKHDKPVRIG